MSRRASKRARTCGKEAKLFVPDMTVADLQYALTVRELDVQGKKAELAKRLQAALDDAARARTKELEGGARRSVAEEPLAGNGIGNQWKRLNSL
jgi:hypothetical protein